MTIQMKNSTSYGLNIDSRLFHAIDPCWLGMLSEDPLLIIQIVFVLAALEAGIGFPSPHLHKSHHSNKFTSFNIWCAGLSAEIFKQISDDLDSYIKLLD